MLVNMNEMLAAAPAGGYGIAMINTFSLELARGVLSAAEELGAPIILGSAEALIPNASLEDVAALLIPMAKRSKVPVAVHLDHGFTEPVIEQALRLGFTSVMYDCSDDPYEDNVRKTADMARRAHAHGASLEAELGHVCFPGMEGEENRYTDPADARDFVERTGVDALAVSIGTAHGPYREAPKLDIARLRAIRDAVDVPLVLHGGSGLTEDAVRACIEAGICKVNYATDLRMAFTKAVQKALAAKPEAYDPKAYLAAGREAVAELVAARIELLGSGGRL